MADPAYPAARNVAAAVEADFARRLAGARREGVADLAPAPAAPDVEALIDVAFWASLRRNEGREPTISLALLPPDAAGQSMRFDRPLPLAADALARLAPAVERPGIHLGVWRDGEALWVWGTTRTVPRHCFVLEVVAPGQLVVKYRRHEGYGKFGNVAVLQADAVKVVDQERVRASGCAPECLPLLAFDTSDEPVSVLVQLAASMRAHRHGGALLVVPHASAAWKASMVWPLSYQVEPPFTGLADLLRREPAARADPTWQEALRRAVDQVAGLTAVDGATVIDDAFELLAFGATIGRAGRGPVEHVRHTEPVAGNVAEVVAATRIGGTRHFSAAQFVHDQRDAVALVASQDGRFTIFAWSDAHAMVHAHRVEALLL